MDRDEHDCHYRRYREEIERSLDAEAWQRSRRSAAGDGGGDVTENAPLAPRDEGVVGSIGRAVAEVFTAPESAHSDDARERRALREREGSR